MENWPFSVVKGGVLRKFDRVHVFPYCPFSGPLTGHKTRAHRLF